MLAKSELNILILLLGIHFVFTTDVELCTGIQTPFVVIKDCQEPPCELVKGTDAEMILTFNSTEYFNQMQLKVLAKVGPITVPYPLPPAVGDVCSNLLNTHCPLEENELGVFKLSMPIGNYPEITLKLTFTIEGENKQKIACFSVNCEVVSK